MINVLKNTGPSSEFDITLLYSLRESSKKVLVIPTDKTGKSTGPKKKSVCPKHLHVLQKYIHLLDLLVLFYSRLYAIRTTCRLLKFDRTFNFGATAAPAHTKQQE